MPAHSTDKCQFRAQIPWGFTKLWCPAPGWVYREHFSSSCLAVTSLFWATRGRAQLEVCSSVTGTLHKPIALDFPLEQGFLLLPATRRCPSLAQCHANTQGTAPGLGLGSAAGQCRSPTLCVEEQCFLENTQNLHSLGHGMAQVASGSSISPSLRTVMFMGRC